MYPASCHTADSDIRRDVYKRQVLYASKAFCIQEMMRLAKRHDLSLDVVSGGELYTALAAGVDPKRIYFHGNNKSPRELSLIHI